jgi:hypothetical protein
MDRERFNKVLDQNADKHLTLDMTPGQVTMIYGGIVFLGAHRNLRPDLQQLYWDRLEVIRSNLEKILRDMGFTEDEIRWLATRGSRPAV